MKFTFKKVLLALAAVSMLVVMLAMSVSAETVTGTTLNEQLVSDFNNTQSGNALSDAKCVAGDANGDGTVDGADAVLLAQHLAMWSVEIDLAAADVDGSGAVDSKDAVRLAQYLAKWDVELVGPPEKGDNEIPSGDVFPPKNGDNEIPSDGVFPPKEEDNE
ncbi:MAG: hypothetical protein E7671_02690 [Ruminococcaceae bacterium]|nr:hypothetical protein [Oscillospiraceae bacterium]